MMNVDDRCCEKGRSKTMMHEMISRRGLVGNDIAKNELDHAERGLFRVDRA